MLWMGAPKMFWTLKCSTESLKSEWACDTGSATTTHQTTPPSSILPPTPAPATEQLSEESTDTVLQLNANGNKREELGVVLERNKVNMAVIQESKLSAKCMNRCILNYTTERKNRPHSHGGGLSLFTIRIGLFPTATLIHPALAVMGINLQKNIF